MSDTKLDHLVSSALRSIEAYDEWQDPEAGVKAAFKVKSLADYIKDNQVDATTLPDRVRRALRGLL